MITRYVLVNRDNQEQDTEYDEFSYDEAVAEAEKLGFAVIERHYTFDDSELVWTPNGSSSWPPT